MSNPPPWREQCEAARRIRAEFGVEKALGYLLGEKIMNFLRAAANETALYGELAAFAMAARDIFTADELRGYFTGPRRIGAAAHVLDDAGFEAFQSAGALEDEDVERAAQDAIHFERMRRILVGE